MTHHPTSLSRVPRTTCRPPAVGLGLRVLSGCRLPGDRLLRLHRPALVSHGLLIYDPNSPQGTPLLGCPVMRHHPQEPCGLLLCCALPQSSDRQRRCGMERALAMATSAQRLTSAAALGCAALQGPEQWRGDTRVQRPSQGLRDLRTQRQRDGGAGPRIASGEQAL